MVTPPNQYVLVGPYNTQIEACVNANLMGPSLGTVTLVPDTINIGSQVYENPLFGAPTLVTTPGWYAISGSFIGISTGIRINSSGIIVEVGVLCFGFI